MSLTLFVGCQKAGKTISNIRKATEYIDIFDTKGLFINSSIDTRDEKNIISSNSSSYNGVSFKLTCIKVLKLSEIYDLVNLSEYKCVSIDEIQFFPDIEEFVVELLKLGKHVFCSGLDSDWMGKDFGHVKELLKYSTDFRKMSAKCKWCVDNDSSYCIENVSNACRTGKISGSENQIECGGDDKYIPLCLKHHNQHLIEIHKIEPFTLKSLLEDDEE